MPAASWSALQEYEAQLDAALAASLAVFAAAPYSFTLFAQDSVDTLSVPRLEYGLTIGDPAGPGNDAQQRAAAGLAARATAFNFSVRFLFVFDRTKISAGASVFRGALRELLAPPAPGAEGAFTLVCLPYLNVAGLQERRSERGVLKSAEGTKLLSIWESNWEGIFNIRAEAMPD